MYKVKVKQFEGPLDLLLQLIEEQKLPITEVALAEVTEQYIRLLNQSVDKKIEADQLADFLVVAARLLLIKSRALLPFLQWEEAADEEELTTQLKIYKQYLAASKVVQSIIAKKRFSFSRQKLLTGTEISFAPPSKLIKSTLAETFRRLLERIEPETSLPTEVIRKTISIQEKIQQIRERIYRQATTHFSDILKESKDKTEVIVSFLALLELVKQKLVVVKQDKTFDDIVIEKFE
jgi:segregation and condensation protein A